jgi:ABC-type antimicrobial peptide transport system permease subunit
MKLFDYIVLGLKNLWRRKSRTFLTILAVVIGAISVIIMLSLVIGAKTIATQQLESINGFTLISVSANPEIEASGNLLSTDSGPTGEQRLNDSTVATVKGVPGVIDATPLTGVWFDTMKLEGQEKRFRANAIGFDPGTEVLNIPVSAGRPLQTDDMDKIIIGTDTVRNFGYAGREKELIGKHIIFTSKGSGYNDWEPDPPKPPENQDEAYWKSQEKMVHEISAEIVGVVNTGANSGDNYITMAWARKLMTQKNWKWDDEKGREMDEQRKIIEDQLNREFESQKQALEEQLKTQQLTDQQRKEAYDRFDKQRQETMNQRMAALGFNKSDLMVLQKTDSISERGYGSILVRADKTENIERIGNDIKKLGLGVSTAKDMLAEIEKIFNLVGLIIGAIGGIVLFVAALGIINTMIMATYERTREIGVMRACGATRGDIRNLFIFEAGILGFMGGVIGLVISYGLAKIGNSFANSIAISESVPINNLLTFPPWLIISVIAITTLIGIVAGLLPAIRASHLDPVEALRSE